MTFRWGVVGPGAIAARFADGMTLVDGGTITAVASRALERANAYGDKYGIATRYASYEDLAADSEVDVVYVATPHSRHERDTVVLVEAGKHVLCEKPFALNTRQAQRMVDAARAHGVFLMEAMWTRFLPSYRALVDVLGRGRIGAPLVVEADFGFRMPVVPEHRLFDASLGGGSLLDLGVYPVQLCSLVLGTPDRVVADGAIGETGVDERVAGVLHHADGSLGVVKAAIRASLSCTARITGTDGWVELPAFMHCPDWITVGGPGGVERIDAAYAGDGLRFQVDEVHRCIGDGRTESDIMPLDETLRIMTTLDAMRAQLGVVYPGE
ncbi:MAG TPA: Gfo/Idh/MocA family oxidoreductase [Acidimicrobiia bacterium]|nr:Gfo/Idh/MocA family oxidoreductase [Acidimicrobiia bacterium]